MRRVLSILAIVPALVSCATPPEAPSADPPPSGAVVMPFADVGRRSGEAVSLPAPAAGAAVAPVVRKGTGRFVKDGVDTAPAATVPGQRNLSLNFANAEIRDVVRTILGEMLGENYSIDPRVQGTVNIETSRPLARAELIPMLEQILAANGAALVRTAESWEIVPTEKALPQLGGTSAAEPGFGLQVLPLEHVSAAEMAKVLQPIAKDGAAVTADTRRNLLMITGPQLQRQAMLDLVRMFDVDWLAGMSFALVPLRVAGAETVVDELQAIFGGSAGPLDGVVRFLPVKRLNAVLVISSRPALLDSARTWLAQLDRGRDMERRRLYIYFVQNGDAAEMAAVLQEVFATGPRLAVAAPLAPGRRGATIGEGPAGAAAAAGDGAAAVAADAAAVAVAAPPRAANGAAEDGVRIISDPRTNSLAILATPDEFEMIEAALQKLDIVPLQVLLEATIAEVTLNNSLRYGVQWFLERGSSQVVLSEAASGAVAPIFPGFNYVVSHDDFRLVLSALESVTDVNVISAPKLLVLDNQTARLQVGDEVPVPVQSARSVIDPDAPIVNTIQFRDTGVILEVRPRVNAGGLVIMNVRQEVSDVVRTVTSGIDAPTIQQRQIESTIAVQSGETIALGGLIRDTNSRGNSGVPFLSRLPIIGFLFGATDRINDRTELLVLITPRVIGSSDDARAVTEELRGRMRQLAPLMRPGAGPL